MIEHKFPADLSAKSSAACLNKCGTFGRQLRTMSGVGPIEYFIGMMRTGPRAYDSEGVWTTVAPPCEPER